MESIIEFFKNFFILTLLLSIFSYLVPGKKYQKYMQFFIGIMMAVILLQPIARLLVQEDYSSYYSSLEELEQRLQEIQFQPGEEVDIFEFFNEDYGGVTTETME